MLELNQLYNMDCMEGMKEFPDWYFDLAIVDPPYGIKMGRRGRWASNKEQKKGYCSEYAKKDWDDKRPDKDYFDTLFKKSKNAIIWGGNYFIDMIMRPTSGWPDGTKDRPIEKKLEKGVGLRGLSWDEYALLMQAINQEP